MELRHVGSASATPNHCGSTSRSDNALVMTSLHLSFKRQLRDGDNDDDGDSDDGNDGW